MKMSESGNRLHMRRSRHTLRAGRLRRLLLLLLWLRDWRQGAAGGESVGHLLLNLRRHHVECFRPTGAAIDALFELHAVAFPEIIHSPAIFDMNKKVGAADIGRDETKTSIFVVKFHDTGRHPIEPHPAVL
jgi:hypothetical protein